LLQALLPLPVDFPQLPPLGWLASAGGLAYLPPVWLELH